MFVFVFLAGQILFFPLKCWSVFVSAGRARPAPTSLVTTLHWVMKPRVMVSSYTKFPGFRITHTTSKFKHISLLVHRS